MRQTLISVLFVLFCSLESNSQSLDSLYVNVYESYQRLSQEYSASAETLYFKAFPDNVYEFLALERHEAEGGEDICKYVQMLGRLTSVNDTLYCRKLINLSVGASLDSDGLNCLQSLLHAKLEDEKMSGTFFFLLSGMTKGEQIRFWQFYWSSLCFKEEYEGSYVDEEAERKLRLVLKRLGRNRQMKRIVRLAYEYSAHQIYFVSSYSLH